MKPTVWSIQLTSDQYGYTAWLLCNGLKQGTRASFLTKQDDINAGSKMLRDALNGEYLPGGAE